MLPLQGLADKPIVTVLNKIDLLKDQKDAVIYEAEKRINTIPISTVTGEGLDHFMKVLQDTLAFKLEDLTCSISYELAVLEYWIRRLGYIEQIEYLDDFMTIQGRIPSFLHNQIKQMANQLELFEGDFMESEIFRDLLPEGFRADSTSSSSSSTPKIIFNSNPEDIFLSKGVELIDWKAVAKGRHSVCKNLDSAL